MKALVTGATGFVGSNLVRCLVQEGWETHILVRQHSTMEMLGADAGRIGIHRCDGSTASMRGIMSATKPTLVFHLASLVLSEHQSEDILPLFQSNLLFGTQLAEAMTQEGVTDLVNTGTAWQHYQSKAYSPVNLYAATKQAYEDVLQYYVEAHGLRVITLELSDTYGLGDPRPKLMNLLRRVALENQPLAMSPGDQYIDVVHVDDVVEAFLVAAKRLIGERATGHEKYSVSSGNPVQLKALVELMGRILGRDLPINWGGRPYRKREVMRPWSGKPLPEWKPQLSIEDGLKDLLKQDIT